MTPRRWLGLLLLLTAAGPGGVRAATVMNYGADGNDYYRFTNPTLACDKASGFTTLITFAMHVNADGTLVLGGDVICTNGVYTGPAGWNSLITAVKAAPTTVTRYEVCIGGWQDSSYDNIKSLLAAQGAGPGGSLWRNFQALKRAVPGIDAINDDDEQTYDTGSSTSLANLLGALGFRFTLAPYTAQAFWVALKSNLTNCDAIYLQCYEGGAGNDPAQWNAAFGNGVVVIPGQESNTANPAAFHAWHLATGVEGGFYYPDVVFDQTSWSAMVWEACGFTPPPPSGLVATPGGRQVILSWNTAPGAAYYRLKRSAVSGAETNLATLATAAAVWPASNEHTDILPPGATNYYTVSAFNTNGESVDSAEVAATAQSGVVLNASFEFDPAAPGATVPAVPAGWNAFNAAGPGDIGSEHAGGVDFINDNPLAAPAEGVQFCYVNLFNNGVPGGLYQDAGALQPNTTYTLTVAIGSRSDRLNSPGVCALIQGTNAAGAVLASGGGLPSSRDTWEDFTVMTTTGASVTGDLTIALSAIGDASTVQADFDNVRLTATPAVPAPPGSPAPVTNPSFEADAAPNGGVVASVPRGWTAFNEGGGADIGSQHAGGGDYQVNNPLGAPADGNQYAYVNMFQAGVTGGIFQDTGALQPNTRYDLTVAIGSRLDRINSPGIIHLVQGSNAAGPVLATGGGVPPGQNSWQDYTASFATGPAVAGDLTIALAAAGNNTTIQADFDHVRLTATPLGVTPKLRAPVMAGGALVLEGTGGVPGGGYTLLSTTNLNAPVVWLTNQQSVLVNGGFTNRIPINPAQAANFYRLRVP